MTELTPKQYIERKIKLKNQFIDMMVKDRKPHEKEIMRIDTLIYDAHMDIDELEKELAGMGEK
jgi:uncharacterized protein (DUF1919 family)